jgi:hypothetical protein
MPERLGEAVLELRTDQQGFESGLDGAKEKTESLTSAMFNAEVAVEFFNKAVEVVTDFLKESIGEFINCEKVVAQTGATLYSTSFASGMTKDSLIELSDAMNGLTGISRDTILSTENVLLRFTKIGKDVFPQVTQATLDIATATDQSSETIARFVGKMMESADAMSSARRMGIFFTDSQVEMGKQLMDSGHKVEYQKMILDQLQISFGGSAKAARETFGGAITDLDSNMEESREIFGGYIAAIGRPFVDEFDAMVKSVNAFLGSSEGIREVTAVLAPLAGVLSIAWDIGKKFFGMLGDEAKLILKDLKTEFTKLFPETLTAANGFELLGASVQLVSGIFNVTLKIIHLVISTIGDLAKNIEDIVGLMYRFADALMSPFDAKKWDALQKSAVDMWNNFGKTAKDVVINTVDVVKQGFDEVNKFSDGARKNSNQLANDFDKAASQVTIAVSKMGEAHEDNSSLMKKSWEIGAEAAKAYAKTVEDATKKSEAAMNMEKRSWEKGADEAAAYSMKKMEDSAKSFSGMFKGALSSTQPIFDAVGQSLVTQGDSWKNVGKAGIMAISGIVKAIGDQLSAMASAKLVEAIANSIDPLMMWAAPGQFAAAGIEGAGAAAAWVAAGALNAWAGSFSQSGTVMPIDGGALARVADNNEPEHIMGDSLFRSVLQEELGKQNQGGSGSYIIETTIKMNEDVIMKTVSNGFRNRKLLVPSDAMVPAY